MAVSVTAVVAFNNPAPFTDPISFEIEYEALTNLQEDLTWKVIYVGCADNDRCDQILEDVAVGPVSAGTFKFVLETNAPNAQLIPPDDLVGITVIMLTCSYREKEFIRVGYYVSVEYIDEELRENPPEQPRVDRLQRTILSDHPRVTRYAIPFDEPEPEWEPQPMEEGEPVPMDDCQSMVDGGVPGGGMGAARPAPTQASHMEVQQEAFGQQGSVQQHPQYVPVQ